MPNTQYPSCVPGGFLSASANYELKPFPSTTTVANIRCTWAFKWFYTGGGGAVGVNSVVIATAGSGQTPGTYSATASTGAATISYTIGAGGTLTAVSITNPGSGYTAAPTFTIAAGGTPGTVTASVGSFAGIEVASGTNLSAETVQFFVIGGEM
jgi:hypothetical protein